MSSVVKREKMWWVLFLATLLTAGFFAIVSLYEFFSVAVLHQTGAYPFGGEGPAPLVL